MTALKSALTEEAPLDRDASKARSSLRYMPGLDVMRGIAISLVLVYHGVASHEFVFSSYASSTYSRLQRALDFGAMGVHLFFILSGFLITGILIDSRDLQDYYKNFYLRRAFRILPAYLLMLAVLRFGHWITWRYLMVSLFYFCNMAALFGARPEYGPLWSLSVEEQFYLTWPFVVRKLSRLKLFLVSVALVVLTPFLRFALLYGPAALHDVHYKTWVLVDFFAAGALLAIAIRSSRLLPYLARVVVPLILAGAASFALLQSLQTPSDSFWRNVTMAVTLEPWLLLFSGLILFAVLHPGIAGPRWVKPLIFLANISYGLYLIHQFIFTRIDLWWALPPAGALPMLLVRFIAEAVCAIAIAYLSRRTLEEFFLRMKPKHAAPDPS